MNDENALLIVSMLALILSKLNTGSMSGVWLIVWAVTFSAFVKVSIREHRQRKARKK